MKRFLLFWGYDYYPSGGWYDFKGSFDSLDAAKEVLLQRQPDGFRECDGDWAHIVDTAEAARIVWRNK